MFGSKVDISWMGFEDPESGITKYQVCLGTAPGRCDASATVVAGTSQHTIELAVNNGLHNTELFATVVAFNGGFKTMSVNATGIAFLVDLTPPVAGTVTALDADDTPVSFVGKSHFARAKWEGFVDPESQVVNYEFAVGTAVEPEKFFRFHSVGCDLDDELCLISVFEAHTLTLAHKASAIVSIRGTNGAGATATSESSPFTGEPTRPGIPCSVS
jgi:hypothetical protein